MTPLGGMGFVTPLTTTLFPLSTMSVFPVNRYAGSTTDFSWLLEGGSGRTGEPGLNVPTKFGGPPLQLGSPRYPGAGAETSMESALVRPKVGAPQVAMSSFVWSGPLITSE